MISITDINIVELKSPSGGLVAVASCKLNNMLFLGCIGIVARRGGGFRLVYPVRKARDKFNIFHPLTREVGDIFETVILSRYEELFGPMNKEVLPFDIETEENLL